jgi:hypothetical protein
VRALFLGVFCDLACLFYFIFEVESWQGGMLVLILESGWGVGLAACGSLL